MSEESFKSQKETKIIRMITFFVKKQLFRFWYFLIPPTHYHPTPLNLCGWTTSNVFTSNILRRYDYVSLEFKKNSEFVFLEFIFPFQTRDANFGQLKLSSTSNKEISNSMEEPLFLYHKKCVATSVLRMRLLHVVAFSKRSRWLAQTKVITLKTQLHAVNACWKRLSQRSFIKNAHICIFMIALLCHNEEEKQGSIL